MSIVVNVRFPVVKLPAPLEWQEAIRANGFDVELDCDFDPVIFSGFLPARHKGRDAGFEYYYDAEGSEEAFVSLVWAGRAREGASAVVAAACLCQLTGGELEDTEAGEKVSASDAVAWARREEAGFLVIAEENGHPDQQLRHEQPARTSMVEVLVRAHWLNFGQLTCNGAGWLSCPFGVSPAARKLLALKACGPRRVARTQTPYRGATDAVTSATPPLDCRA